MYPLNFTLRRYADRKGTTVHWGNIIGGFQGQEFIEEFDTEEEAIERERQAVSCESIGNNRLPVAKKRKRIR